jgi:hypothetical protein
MLWVVNATPRPLYPRERPGTHCIRGRMDPRTGLNRCAENRIPTGIRFPDRPLYSESLIPTELSRPTYGEVYQHERVRKNSEVKLVTATVKDWRGKGVPVILIATRATVGFLACLLASMSCIKVKPLGARVCMCVCVRVCVRARALVCV